MTFNYQVRQRLGWVLFVIAARVATYWFGGHRWEFGTDLSTWLTWTFVLVGLVANHNFERREEQAKPAPSRRVTDEMRS